MKAFPSIFSVVAAMFVCLVTGSCHRKNAGTSSRTLSPAPEISAEAKTKAAQIAGLDQEHFRYETRMLYNSRHFEELEAIADHVRSTKSKFDSGRWKIVDFYDSLGCQDDEPETMWKTHDKIQTEWEQRYPNSITPRVAHGWFFIDYAWHARGNDYANKVTAEGQALFEQRLASARTILDQSKTMNPACPCWWTARMKVGLGQGEKPAIYKAIFDEAKTAEPQFSEYDLAYAYYLLPRWYGKPGDWEAMAEKEISRNGGLGHEGYARVVIDLSGYYDNIYTGTKASWEKTKKGFEEMRSRYPDSKAIPNVYCRHACIAGDREQAKKLFAEIGDKPAMDVWRKGEYARAKAWAMKE